MLRKTFGPSLRFVCRMASPFKLSCHCFSVHSVCVSLFPLAAAAVDKAPLRLQGMLTDPTGGAPVSRRPNTTVRGMISHLQTAVRPFRERRPVSLDASARPLPADDHRGVVQALRAGGGGARAAKLAS